MSAQRDIKLYLQDILQAVEQINKYTADSSEVEFYQDVRTQDAVLRRLEIIGEAVNKLPAEVKQKHNQIPWDKIVATRNALIHGYFNVKLERVWNTVQDDLPLLKRVATTMMSEASES